MYFVVVGGELQIAKLVTSYWLQKYKIEISANTMTIIETYASFGLTSIQLPHYPNESKYHQRILTQFNERKKLEKRHLTQLTFHNDYRSVIHQTKLYDLMNDSQPFISTECNITISCMLIKVFSFGFKAVLVSQFMYIFCCCFLLCFFFVFLANVWCNERSNPTIFEFRLDYVKNDIFLGIITDQYKSTQSFTHHIGGDGESLGISLRECIAYFKGQSIKSLKRSDYLNADVRNSIYDISRNKLPNVTSLQSNDSLNHNLKSSNPAAQVYNLQKSRTSVIADHVGM